MGQVMRSRGDASAIPGVARPKGVDGVDTPRGGVDASTLEIGQIVEMSTGVETSTCRR
jgi:hypothetical protein